MLVALAGGVGAVLQYGLLVLAGPWAWPLIALLAVAGLAQRSLYDHVAPVALALEAGDVPAARAAVAMIVGRDTEVLDEAGIARAAIESLAESFCDGVVAPLRSEEHTSELQSLMRISYAVFCLKKKKTYTDIKPIAKVPTLQPYTHKH